MINKENSRIWNNLGYAYLSIREKDKAKANECFKIVKDLQTKGK